ncbi:hypothetical protein M409DRAFT_20335 [Zasmidium cellare ATCC 36951]|uniref:Uncharacterized protein n=1 Tax=Zasmidium cellare ATCC 36951 TaxID=1080233 RepID=A0A6A6CUF3_ZASCE|nr:uncharacterized protein M409DRAFT_20335 [Zasmidium cellare ATCC 36951]KAF2169106.1 hypothetical protein M409DRAFT_20335 [Zasmidium cellare ATCC 36951]
MDSRISAVQGMAVEDDGRASSVYSESSDHRQTHLDSRNGSRNGSRHASYTPSYMSNIAAKSTEALTIRTTQSREGGSRPIPPSPLNSTTPQVVDTPSIPPPSPSGPPGLLLVLIANTVHPSTIFYLEMLLNRQTFSGILFVASKSQEAALKQLKMDVYALIGRLRQELVVAVHMKHEWNQVEMETFAAEATKHGDGLQGVICCPEFDETGTADVDVLTLGGDQLERSWNQSVSFLHAAIKATAIHLLTRCKPVNPASNGLSARTRRGPFFLVAGSTTYTSASKITKSACDTLVLQLERATQAKGLTVGFAEALLIPEPSREPPPKPGDELPVETETYDAGHEDYEFVPSESPTKLWSSWALHNDLGFVED